MSARAGTSRPWRSIGAIAAGFVATWEQGPEFGPKWYPILLIVTALPCVWAGGVLAIRSGSEVRGFGGSEVKRTF